jgi:ribonucleoside-diphosphate reductase alpha chain
MTAKQIMSKIKPKLAEQSMAVAKKRYMRTDEEGNAIETPEEMFYRVANFMASAETKFDANADTAALTEQFYQIMAKLEFVPAGRCFFEAGNDHTGQMASCFVLPLEDSVEEIFQTLKDAAITQQNNGGTGFNFSKIRPKGDSVNGVPGVAAGPIHYLKSFDQSFSQILQGGKRHGGNMGVLNIDHPDIEEFIKLKDQGSSIKNFNISVGVKREFMEAVRNDAPWNLVNPRDGKVTKTLQARELFDMITQRAWECADPGMIFLDAIADGNNNAHLYDMVATNPCGEQPLGPYESCNLGSLVLANHVTPAGEIDWAKITRTATLGARFLDNMIELNKYPIPAIDYMVRQTRKTGFGVMGFAQMLYKIGVPYNSQEAVDLIEKIMKHIAEACQAESMVLAEERGVYPAWKGSRWEQKGIKIRNSHLTSIAPTGTISMLANTSSGIEPFFNLVTIRKSFFNQSGDNSSQGATTMRIVAEDFEKVAKERGFYSEALMDKVAEEGTLANIPEIPEDVKAIFVTTHDVQPEWHTKIQAAAQKYTDSAVSKTVNLPADATVEDVRRAYILGYETGCKGITIYRDGSKSGQVLSLKKKTDEKQPEAKVEPVAEPVPVTLPERPVNNFQEPKPVTTKQAATMSTSIFEAGAELNPEAFITPNAQTVLEKRALQKDEAGNVVENPDQLFRRVAKFVASPEANYDVSEERRQEIEDKFHGMLSRLEFIAGQPLRNADSDLTMSACLVLPIEDSIEGIMQTISENVFAHKSTCGTGMNYSRLRMKGSTVGEVGPIAAGPVNFMRAVSVAQKTVQTKGGRSQGSMGILNVDHPDIQDFIKAKDVEGQFDNMNISIGATDKFMEAVKNGTPYDMVDPGTNSVVSTPNATDIFDEIAEHAWVSGDPGVIFVDRLERDNPTPSLGKLDATNPCGEQPLLPYETCNLGSIVLSRMVTRDAEGNIVVDWEKLAETTYYATRFLDNTIDVNNFPLAKVEQMSRGTRRIGLGAMGFADLCIKMGIAYNSPQAVELAEQVMEFINVHAHQASELLGAEKGSFPYFDISVWPGKGVTARRNSAVTTIAPTGYTSIVANCSSGIEPIYALSYRRENSMGGVDQYETNYLFEKVAKERGFYTEEIMNQVAELGTIKDIDGIPQDVKDLFVTAFDTTPEWHVRIQAAFQAHTDNAVSKTINFPNHATVADIKKTYQLAYDLGCKGVTVFRDGSRDEQALQVGKTAAKKTEEPAAASETITIPDNYEDARQLLVQAIEKRPRPQVTHGKTYRKNTGYGKMYVTVNDDENGNPFEVFATIGKTGGLYAAKSESICRLASLALRSGIKVENVIRELKGIRGPMPIWDNGTQVFSIADAVAQVLDGHIKANQSKMELKFEEKAQLNTDHVTSVAEPDPAAVAPEPASAEATAGTPVVAQPKISFDTHKDVEKVVVTTTETQEAGQAVVKTKVEHSSSHMEMGMSSDCPDCSSRLEFSEGCLLCRGCGYSKCG